MVELRYTNQNILGGSWTTPYWIKYE